MVIDGNSVRDIDNEGYDVSLSQTLFNLSAWFGWRAGKETSRQAEANLAAAQQDLIVRVVQAYFAVLRAQDNLRASQAQERAFERQLEQTRQRFEVGLIAITDVYEAEAARDLAQVTRIVDENNVAVAKENLSVLTGQAPGALYVLGEEFDPRPPEPNDRAEWVDFALSNNSELAAARYAEEAARQNATSSKMEHAPTVTATTSAPRPPSAAIASFHGASPVARTPWVAPKSRAIASFCSLMSTATMRRAPAMRAPWITLSPMPPKPNTATFEPGVTLAVLMTAPMPVVTPQPM